MTTPRTGTDPWVRLGRITAVTGLSSIVLLFATIIPLAALGEPAFTASNDEARAYLVNVSVGWPQTVIALSSVAAIGILWFVVGLTLVLRRAEGDPPWRSTIALVSGVLLTAYTAMDASLDAAASRGADLDPAVAGYAFAVGSVGFANAWLALASFAVCAGWVVVATGIFGRWLGWWAIISGLGLALSRFFWTSEIWLLPYGLFWVWMIIVCVRLLRWSPNQVNALPQSAPAA
ncbi:MAG TPA: hypothetical protein VJ301_14940 [Propionibacteriaceae bacterium]|nr:hypothetical protein [Propionibacteriaceae bacterium]